MDSKDFAIGILSTTAAILLVGVLIVHSRPAPVLASGMAAAGGAYTLTVGTFTIGDEEVVFVIDAPSEKMLTYRFNTGKGQIERVDAIDLAEMRQAATPPPQKPATKKARKSKSPKKRGRRP